jgi:hypothetical protein
LGDISLGVCVEETPANAMDSRVAAPVTPFFSFGRGLGRSFGAVRAAPSVASCKLGTDVLTLFLRLVGFGAIPPSTISWVAAIVDFLNLDKVVEAPVLDPSCASTVSRGLSGVGKSSGAGAFSFPLVRAFGLGRGFAMAFGVEGTKTSVLEDI